MKSEKHFSRKPGVMDSHPREIPAIGAASTIRGAIIRAGRSGHAAQTLGGGL